jgi:UTP-glucose-1-phosphate uridylyltransferase
MMQSSLMAIGLNLLVMAAGLGKRYGGSKQFDYFGQAKAAISEYTIFDAISNGIDRVVFILREEMKNFFCDHINSKLSGHCEVDFVFQTNQSCFPQGQGFADRDVPWGTGHAILCARDRIKGNFLVVNADDFYGPAPMEMMAKFIKTISADESIFGCAGYLLKKTLSAQGAVSRGICEMTDDDNLINIREVTDIQRDASNRLTDPSLNEESIASMNLWAFTPRIFHYLDEEWKMFSQKYRFSKTKEFFITTAINNMLKKNLLLIKVLRTDARWVGVTYRGDRETVDGEINKLLAEGIYPVPLWQ